MAYENDILTRNDNDELAVRTVQTTGDNPGAYDDIYTRDNNGKLCVRVTGVGGGGGSDPHNLGWYATQSALETAHPTAEDGDWAIVGSTDTVWVWDSDTNAWKDTDQKGQVESVNGQTGTVVLTASDVGAATTAQGAKADTAVQPGDLATVATSGSYDDLTDKPTIPAAQVNSDWNAVSGVEQILNKPTLGTAASANTTDFATAAQGALAATAVQPGDLATVATTGNYSDLSGTPTIPAPTQVSALPTAGADELGNIYQFVGTTDANYTNGYFYKCVSDGQDPATYSWEQTDVMPAGSSLPDQTGQSGKFLTTDGTDASWASVDTLPSASGHNNQLLWVNYGTPSWSNRTYVSESKIMFGRQEGTAQNGDGFAVGMYYKLNPGAGTSGVAIGGTSPEVLAPFGIAVGSCQRANAYGAIQIGAGDNNGVGMSVNSDPGTMNVALKKSANNSSINVKLLDSDGTIPTARLTKVNSTITLAVADWSSNTQTVTVNGVTSTSVVFVAPDPADTTDYVSAGILCTSQTTNSLTFTATTTPTSDIAVNVVCL